jgi:hypothetical protein
MLVIGLLSFVAEIANELVANRLKRPGWPTRAHTSSESAPTRSRLVDVPASRDASTCVGAASL